MILAENVQSKDYHLPIIAMVPKHTHTYIHTHARTHPMLCFPFLSGFRMNSLQNKLLENVAIPHQI